MDCEARSRIAVIRALQQPVTNPRHAYSTPAVHINNPAGSSDAPRLLRPLRDNKVPRTASSLSRLHSHLLQRNRTATW
jgi:hypothetical protein